MTNPAPLSGATPVRVALVGCGRISRNHVEALERIEGFELVSVADSELARAEAVAAERAIPAFSTLEAMLDAVPSDLVSICTPFAPFSGARATYRTHDPVRPLPA